MSQSNLFALFSIWNICSSAWIPHQFCFHRFQIASLLHSPYSDTGGHLFFKLDPGAIPASLQLRKRSWFIMARESENYRLQDSGIWCEGKPTMIAAGGELWLTEDLFFSTERVRDSLCLLQLQPWLLNASSCQWKGGRVALSGEHPSWFPRPFRLRGIAWELQQGVVPPWQHI